MSPPVRTALGSQGLALSGRALRPPLPKRAWEAIRSTTAKAASPLLSRARAKKGPRLPAPAPYVHPAPVIVSVAHPQVPTPAHPYPRAPRPFLSLGPRLRSALQPPPPLIPAC